MAKQALNKSLNGPAKTAQLKVLLAFWWVILALITATPAHASDSGFSIQSASLQKEGDNWFLQAMIDYQLPETAIEALNNGVPLTINIQFKLKKSRPWLWPETVFYEAQKISLRYLGLAKLYQVTNLSKGQQYHFASFQAAIDRIGNLRTELKEEAAPFLIKRESLFGKLKTELEIEALPLPLRPVAYLTPQWYLSSGWFEWPLTN